jgi:protease-4
MSSENRDSSIIRAWFWLPWIACAVLGAVLVANWSGVTDYLFPSSLISETFVSGDKVASDKIAILNVEGVLMEGQGFLKHQIDQIRGDKSVKAVVLRVDSPGGTVTASDYVLHHLNELRKENKIPIVVSMGSMAASGGYYISMAVGDQEKSIYAEPTTATGSIGVIIPHYDITGLMAKFDVKDDSIVSHPRKQMLSMTRPLTEDTRPIVQGYVDEAFVRFKGIIKDGRPKFREDPAALDALATGEIFSADKAKQLGLIDEIGFIEAAIARAADLAKVDPKKARVVRYNRPAKLFDLSSIGAAKASGSPESLMLQTLAEAATPRAWYIYTSVPGLPPGKVAD